MCLWPKSECTTHPPKDVAQKVKRFRPKSARRLCNKVILFSSSIHLLAFLHIKATVFILHKANAPTNYRLYEIQ